MNNDSVKTNDPAFLFYSSDFLMGISNLTMEERGQYISLLCVQHQKGSLSEKTIKLVAGNVSKDVMEKFVLDENGNYYNKRLLIETEKRNSFVNSRKENGSKGGRPKDIVEDITPSKPEVEAPKEDGLFEKFWNMYDKKTDKEKCIKRFARLKKSEIELIFKTLPDYLLSAPNKQYRKNPLTWLNGNCWNDEIKTLTNRDKKFKVQFRTPQGRTTTEKTETEIDEMKKNPYYTIEKVEAL